MKSSHIKRLLLIIGAFTIAGCSLFDGGVFEIKTDKVTREYVDSHRRITITEIPDLTDGKILGKKLPNPYSMDVMTEAWEILHPRTREDPDTTDHDLEATHIYVRMLPEDASDVDWLLESDYEFFNYPLDYEILGDPDEYHDPSLPDSTVTWLYTVMPIDATLPSMDYEIVDVCYIPDDGPQNNNPNGLTPIEQVAFGLVGGSELNDVGDIDWEEPEPGDGTHPGGGTGGNGNLLQGNIKYYDSMLADMVGVKGLKIVLRSFLKVRTAYTDEYGHYETPNVFYSSPSRVISFKNQEGFLGRYVTQVSDLWKKKTLDQSSWYIDSITDGRNWALANINNAAYDWYEYCESSGIQKPANNLRFMAIEPAGGASTLMLAHGMMYHLNISEIMERVFQSTYQQLIVMAHYYLLSPIISLFGPDVVICGINVCSSSMIYEYISHELSHASHFQQLGQTNSARCSWWSNVFSYELTNIIESGVEDTYGSASDPGNGPCGVTEMWAFCMGCYRLYDYTSNTNTTYPGDSYWFRPEFAWDLVRKYSYITPVQLFGAMTGEITDITSLKNKLKTLYPSICNQIDSLYHAYYQ